MTTGGISVNFFPGSMMSSISHFEPTLRGRERTPGGGSVRVSHGFPTGFSPKRCFFRNLSPSPLERSRLVISHFRGMMTRRSGACDAERSGGATRCAGRESGVITWRTAKWVDGAEGRWSRGEGKRSKLHDERVGLGFLKLLVKQ